MRPILCATCRRPGEKRLCDECARDDRRTYLLACVRCGDEFTARVETHRFCLACLRIVLPTIAALYDEPADEDREIESFKELTSEET